MGPILIFDKSTLQSLSLDEAVWLDNSYLTNITPLFFIETLADLEKGVKSGKTPEQVVGNLAEKTPDLHSSLNVHHMALIIPELLGVATVDMKTGRPHIGGGRPIELDGKSGVMFDPTPEQKAFHRWQDGNFLEIERTAAKMWRQSLAAIDLEGVYALFKERLPSWSKPKTLTEVKEQVDNILNHQDQENLLRMALSLLVIDEGVAQRTLMRWQVNRPPVKDFAPYFTYVFSVDLFFYLAIAADLIGRGRASHKVDIAYLYYLPFCMVFSSNDHLHKDVAPLFLRGTQTFVEGTAIKADLQALVRHYDSIPAELKDRGMFAFASYPPDDDSFLLTRLWDKHMNPKWREHKQEHDNRAASPQKDIPKSPIFEALRKAEKGAPMKPYVPTDLDAEPHQVVVKRRVRAKKGRWERFPPEVRDGRKNKDGEREDSPQEGRSNP